MGKTITTYLIDGHPQGVQNIFISNKICSLMLIPRSSLDIVNKREELKTPAFYTDFLWIYLMGEYNRLRELVVITNLNAQMIKDYNVVIPPLSIQEKIINDYGTLKAIIKLVESEYEILFSFAESEFEKQIFN
jgi:restriction endonuclease S subunit